MTNNARALGALLVTAGADAASCVYVDRRESDRGRTPWHARAARFAPDATAIAL